MMDMRRPMQPYRQAGLIGYGAEWITEAIVKVHLRGEAPDDYPSRGRYPYTGFLLNGKPIGDDDGIDGADAESE